MLRIVMRALVSRRTQTVTLVLLALLVTASAVAAPFYVYASTERIIGADLDRAPKAQRIVTIDQVAQSSALTAAAIPAALDAEAKRLVLTGFTVVKGARVAGQAILGDIGVTTSLAIRDDVCAHVTIDGRCPAAAGEVMVSAATANDYQIKPGDRYDFRSPTINGGYPFAVVGVYTPRDISDPYWGLNELAADVAAQAQLPGPFADAMFTTADSLIATKSSNVTLEVDEIMPTTPLSAPRALVFLRRIRDAEVSLTSAGMPTTSDIPALSRQVIDDSNAILVGVPLGAAQLVLFGWFALALCIRATTTARRADIGILKLRGVRRLTMWRLVIEQSVVPIAIGTPLGVLVGILAARVLAGPIRADDDLDRAVVFAACAALLAVAGALVTALLAERRALRASIVDLLRTTPPRRRGWRADLADLLVVVIAVVGVIQIRGSHAAGGGLSVLAPGLLALAAGLLMARLLIPASRAAITRCRRTGRVRGLLVATYLARRPGLDRMFALIGIAVALCTYAVLAWGASAQARAERSRLEAGASQVLRVSSVPPAALLAAVRAADPSGRAAMAVTETAATQDSPAVLAVDAGRLAAVAAGSPGLTTPAGRLAKLVHPSDPSGPAVTGAGLRLAATTTVPYTEAPGGPANYLMVLLDSTAGPRSVVIGPLHAGARTYTASVPGCSAAQPCPLIGFRLAYGAAPTGADVPTGAPLPGTAVTLNELDQQGPDRIVVDGTRFTDLAAWRPTLLPGVAAPLLAPDRGGLSLRIPAADGTVGGPVVPTAYVYSVPNPIPAILAGPAPRPAVVGEISAEVFGDADIPVRIVGRVADIPRIERGWLVDLEYAQIVTQSVGQRVADEVWLAPDAPSGIVAKLRAAGLTIAGTDSADARAARYAGQASVVGLRFALLGGLVALATAAVALLVVASVERQTRAPELVALRHQGVSARHTAAIARRGIAWLTGGALIAGLLGGLMVRAIIGRQAVFADGWRVLGAPPAFPPVALAAAVGLSVAAVAIASAIAAAQLNAAVRARIGDSRR